MYKQYKTQSGELAQGIIRLSDSACIPFDPDNTDYQAYLLWCEQGNTLLPAENI